jgi:hypothetical protein
MCDASLAMLSDGGEGKIVRLGQHLGYGMLQFFRISGIGQLQTRLIWERFHWPMKKGIYYMLIKKEPF